MFKEQLWLGQREREGKVRGNKSKETGEVLSSTRRGAVGRF